ncbi:YfiR family protein [Dechloromonas sp. XY25]|uniref:YfiR family protein n=1 Tax=Dechloromonas hankyongensis TaxID=2908002 RepID=A0ABS9K508_9RHOO|nr:YfiR family protein [Dechloromonas hankyongensis]MCG2578220.1 YfiR family protein [Dechloromonas hankyongensis]
MRALLALFLFWISQAAYAQVVAEPDMKAAYLYNFAHLFEWPESKRANFHICVLGDDEVGAALQGYDERRVNGQRMVIARLNTPTPIRLCDILYVGTGEVVNLPKIRSILGNQPTLTVTERGALQSVGIALALENKRLMFDVNLEHCERINLKAKPTLLELARSVRKSFDGK